MARARWSTGFSGISHDVAPIASFLFGEAVHSHRTARNLVSRNSLRLRNVCRRGAVFVTARRDKRSTTPGGLVLGVRRSDSHRCAGVEVQGQNLAYARLSDWCERRVSR